MSDDRAAQELLDERPELAPALESVLEVDDSRDGWTFDDVDIDSGRFGELVSRGVVEKTEGEYRLADPTAVRAALDGDATVDGETGETGVDFDLDVSLPDIDRQTVGLVSAALAVVVLARTYVLGSIYRGGDIVLSGNDPYYYRYWVEQITAEASGSVDFAALSVLPNPVTKGEPLMVATLWWVAELFGGTTESIGHVLAWYPVVSAVVSGMLVYLLAIQITDDQRVGLASVLFLAIIPGHAFRTSLGYADHHAFDYPWLGLTALALVLITTAVQDRESLARVRPWAAGVALGIGISGQVLAWEAGPLLIIPVGLVVVGNTLLNVYNGRAPVVTNAPILVGTALAAGLVWTVHTTWGWHTDIVASTPGLLFVGVVGVISVATVVSRLGGNAVHLAGVDLVGAILVVLLGQSMFTETMDEALSQINSLFRSDAIAETYGLFNPGTLGFLLLLGFVLVMALPVMVSGVRRTVEGKADWLAASVYVWYFLVLAAIQVRFVGELATFVAVFAGYAFVWVVAKVDVARPPVLDGSKDRISVTVPDTRTLASLCVLFLLFGSLGIVQVPVKTSQTTVDSGVYQTATAIEADVSQQGVDYPESYVLSQWGNNRVFNYFANGESRSYSYARVNYADFVRSTDESTWFGQLRGRVGYVVTRDREGAGPQTLQTRLQEHYGSQSGQAAGLGHYRAVYATNDGQYKAFELVPGAVINGTATANTTVTATTTVTIPNAEFEYTRQTATNSTGQYRLVVANAGNYTVSVGNETTTVRVTQSEVWNGTTVSVN